MTTRPTEGGITRNAVILLLCNMLFICSISIDLALTGIVGARLSPTPALATLPFALITVGTALTTWGASDLMSRIGRRAGFMSGTAMGAAGGLVSVWSVLHAQFWGFCLGTMMVGIWQAFSQYYRLAAADNVADATKPRMISWVLAGGLGAALAGPALANWSRGWLHDPDFAGAYLAVAGLAAISLILLLVYRDSADLPQARTGTPVPFAALFARPDYRAALASSVVSGVVMMFLMTAAPIAALKAGLGVTASTSVIQWHLLGMYGPSLFTGMLIGRFGLGPVLQTGIAIMVACVAIAISAPTDLGFHAALLALGLGWNFMFVSGTTLLARSHTPEERARAQGFAEFLRYTGTALGALLAGPLLEIFGWATLNLAVLPLLLLAAWVTLGWHKRQAVLP
ncbi:MFS transporter [Acidimangrovimonas sediminis]|uniref:MFS transporter n=1 Tax=Acidimangrovimonas sediminis TaxID=2056283 RepID=UPI000C7FB86D|nr:MFS transporter [Acidimangrovimonas sediminis]